MAKELGWNLKKRSEELMSVFKCYYPLQVLENPDDIAGPDSYVTSAN